MKNPTIYEVYVKMQDQAQCDRMLQLCKDYDLPYWESSSGFTFIESKMVSFGYDYESDDFYCIISNVYPLNENRTEVTEEQFIQILKDR